MISVQRVQQKIGKLGFQVEIPTLRALIDKYADQPVTQVIGMDAEFKEMLLALGITVYSDKDIREIIRLHWHPYIQDARARTGVQSLLARLRLKGFRLGVVANIWSGGMNPALKKLGLHRFFDTIIASVDVGYRKPDPKIFKLAIRHLRIQGGETMMVGDNPASDIKGAHDLGMWTARLMRGPNRTKPDKVPPDFRIRNLSELTRIVPCDSS
jgi:HAD superfamily hydrolase (TIGR01662 family)